MLQNAYIRAKIGADTAENKRNFAENLLKIGNYPIRGQYPTVGSPQRSQRSVLQARPRTRAYVGSPTQRSTK